MTSSNATIDDATFGRKIANMDKEIKKLYRKVSNTKKVETIQAGGLSLPTASPSDDVSDFVKRAGDSFTGPIGFEPKLITIADGAIDIGEETDFHGSRVIVNGESSADDFLVAINNPKYNGQLLFLQGIATLTITLVDATSAGTAWAISTGYSTGVQVESGNLIYVCHTGHTSAAADEPGVGANWEDFWTLGNIETLDGASFAIEDDDIIILQYDSTDDRWQQITSGKQSVGDNTQIIDGDSKVIVNDTTPDVQIQLDGVTLASWNKDGGGVERLLFNTGTYLDMNGESVVGLDVLNPDAGVIRVTDESVIHALTGFMGFACGPTVPDTSHATNVGTLQIPYIASTDSSPSASTLNNWFGGVNGCIGMQYDSSATAGQKNNLWGRINSGWQRFVQF